MYTYNELKQFAEKNGTRIEVFQTANGYEIGLNNIYKRKDTQYSWAWYDCIIAGKRNGVVYDISEMEFMFRNYYNGATGKNKTRKDLTTFLRVEKRIETTLYK